MPTTPLPPAAPTAPDEPPVEIRLLGPPEVIVDGRPWRVDTRKATAIMALLATERRPFAREELAALLWPESDDEGARGALRRTLSTLRAAVGKDVLRIDRDRVALEPSRVRVDLDVVAQVAAAERVDRTRLHHAAALARGGFLAGFSLRDSPEWDDWRAARAVTVERAVVAVLDRLVDAAEAAGDRPAAIEALTRRLAVDPLDETAHVRLMVLYAADGDRGAALRQYRTCVAVLDRELAVGPLPETTARYEAIRDGVAVLPGRGPGATMPASGAVPAIAPEAPVLARPGPVEPVRRPPLIGRGAELALILDAHRASADGRGRRAAIIGEPGIGKTRLMEAIAEDVRGAGGLVVRLTAAAAERTIPYGTLVGMLGTLAGGPDGAAPDAGTAGPTEGIARLPSSVRAELARLVPALGEAGVAAPGGEGPGAHARLVTAIGDALAGLVAGPAPGAILVDDAHWLDPATTEALAAFAHRLGRFPLLLAVSWRPAELEGPVARFAESLEGASGDAVVTLGRLTDAEVTELVDAARSHARAAAPDVQRTERLVAAAEGLPLYVVEALAADPSDVPALPRGVRAMIRERLASLPPGSAQVLAAAGVVGRSVDEETLRQVSGRAEDEVVEAIDDLVRRGLLEDTPAGIDVTHGAIREVVLDGLGRTRRRLLHRRVAEAYRLDVPRLGREDLRRLVLIAEHEQAAGRQAEAALAAAAAGARAAEVFANEQAIEQLEAAIALGHPDRVGLLVEVGRLRSRLGDYDAAIAALESAASTAEPAALAAIDRALGRAHLRRGDLQAARHHLVQAAERSSGVSEAGAADPAVAAAALADLSTVERREHRPHAAIATAEQALAAAGGGSPIVAGAARRARGLARLDIDDPAGALDDLLEAARAAAADPDPGAAVAARIGIALAYAAAGDLDGARREGAAAVEGCRRIGDRHLEGAVENHLADLFHAAGLRDESLEHLARAAAAFAEVGGDAATAVPGIWMLAAS